MIPKLIHQIWLGEQPMHPVLAECTRRWAALHPGWDVILWSDPTGLSSVGSSMRSRVDAGPEYAALLARACHLSQRSNIWRYLITSLYGGVYADTDVEPLRPVDDLVSWGRAAFAARRSLPDGLPAVYECAFYGAELGHPWVEQLAADLHTRDPAVPLSMGVDYFTQVTAEHPGVTILPRDLALFQPPDDWEAAKLKGEVPALCDAARLPPAGAYVKHHWSSNWFPPSFQQLPRS
jgi:mannosyltransferase OCH1-like enzyme